jgi:hypothetical protein
VSRIRTLALYRISLADVNALVGAGGSRTCNALVGAGWERMTR